VTIQWVLASARNSCSTKGIHKVIEQAQEFTIIIAIARDIGCNCIQDFVLPPHEKALHPGRGGIS